MRPLPSPLESERVRLRYPTQEDLEPWYRILTTRGALHLMRPEVPWTRGRVREKIDHARQGARSGRLHEMAVELRSTHGVIGRVALKTVDPFHARAEVAYWFDPAWWGQGLASEAVHLLCREGFRTIGLHRVDAVVYRYNRRSLALLRRLGFRQEGTLREAHRFGRGWTAEVRLGLLAGELRPPPGRRPSPPTA